jgi:spore germination protein YaaH
MTCKGICVRYKAQKPVGTGRYASGQRRCQICEIFIKWEGLWCPCCGYRLRTKPRNLKYKAKLRARVEADSIEAEAKTIADMEKELAAEVAKAKTKAKAKTTKAKTTKAKTTKAKTTKSKEKTPCQYCEKPYVFIDKHEKKCEKNPILLNQ